jgi:signal transduction histidine kinase
MALAPLKVGHDNRGVLVIMHRTDRVYGEEWLSLLGGIAPIISLAVQNAIHYLEARERTLQLIRLNDIGLALTRGVSGLDLPVVLRVIIDGVNATLHTERASIFLIDEDTGELVLNCTNEGGVEIRLAPPWSGSIAGWVATHNRPRLLNDPLNDPDYMSDVADRVGYQINSLLCTPILVEGRVIGVIEALNKQNGQPFYEWDQEELIEFAKWAAIAIHNTRLFEQRLLAYQRLASEQRRRHAAEARSAMAAIILDMAHTMNNIIGAIRFWTLDLQDEALARADQLFQEGLAEILRNAEEAIELISKARHPYDKIILEPTDVQACLAQAIQSCAWPSNVSRRENYAPGLPLARANRRRLESVFQNLLLNGIQALAPQGGEIYLRTGISMEGWIEIRIADNGPGIPSELQDRIFDAHFSSKEEGLGLGLWLVETFIRQIEGQVNFSSSAKGTSFIIMLPLWLADK